MNDLISKSALLKRIGDEVRNQAELYADRNNLVVLAYGDCYEKVQTAPTIDAVPVVRCKDCKYNVLTNQRTGHTLCKQGVTLYQCVDFCSLGERKEE